MLRVGVKGGDYSGWRWSCQFAFTYTVEGGVAAGGEEGDVYREWQQDEAMDAGAEEPGEGFGKTVEGVHMIVFTRGALDDFRMTFDIHTH